MRHSIGSRYPLLWVIIPVIGGIVGGELLTIPPICYLVCTIFSFVGLVVAHRKLSRVYLLRRYVMLFALSMVLFFGSFAAFRTTHVNQLIAPIRLEKRSYCVQLVHPLPCRSGWHSVEVRLIDSMGLKTKRRAPKLLLVIQQGDSDNHILLAGSCLQIEASFDPILSDCDPFLRDLSSYYRSRMIVARGFVDSLHWKRVDRSFDLSVVDRLHNFQLECAERIDASIESRTSSALMQAMMLGYKSDLSSDTKEAFRSSGLSHVLAVSGLHVGIVALLINFLLWFVPTYSRFRWFKWAISVVLILLYAVFTGFSVSVVRASLLFVILQTASYFRVQRMSLNALFLVALLQLAYQPLFLYDIGFQLSYLAVGSILWMSPKWEARIWQLPAWMRWFLSMVAVSLVVQLLLFPLLLYHFHQFPVGFLFANLLVLPLLPWIMAFGFVWLIALFCGLEWGFATYVVAQLFDLIGYIAREVGGLQPLSFDRVWVSWVSVVLMYGAAGALCFRLGRVGKLNNWLLFFIFFFLFLSVGYDYFGRNSYRRLALYSVGRGLVLHVVSYSSSWVVLLDGSIDDSRLAKRIEGVLMYKSIDSVRRVASPYFDKQLHFQLPLLECCEKRFFVADSHLMGNKIPSNPFVVDYLLLTPGYRDSIDFLAQWCLPKLVLCSSRVPYWQLDALRSHPSFGSVPIIEIKQGSSWIESL